MGSLLSTLLTLSLLFYVPPEPEEIRARRLQDEERVRKVRTMLIKIYHYIIRVLVTKYHLKEMQREELEIMAAMAAVEITNFDATWQVRQGEGQAMPGRIGPDTSDEESNLHVARQAMDDIISSYIEFQELRDDAAEGLKQVQDDLKWFLLIVEAKMTRRNIVRSRFSIMKGDIDGGCYETEVSAAFVTMQLAIDGSWEEALSDRWS